MNWQLQRQDMQLSTVIHVTHIKKLLLYALQCLEHLSDLPVTNARLAYEREYNPKDCKGLHRMQGFAQVFPNLLGTGEAP